jgi:hypothetical protein
VSQIVLQAPTKRFGRTVAVDDLTATIVRPTAGRATFRRPLMRRAGASHACHRGDARGDRTPSQPHSAAPPSGDGDADGHLPRAVEHVLDMVGLTDAADRKVGGFPLGMRHRLLVVSMVVAKAREVATESFRHTPSSAVIQTSGLATTLVVDSDSDSRSVGSGVGVWGSSRTSLTSAPPDAVPMVDWHHQGQCDAASQVSVRSRPSSTAAGYERAADTY